MQVSLNFVPMTQLNNPLTALQRHEVQPDVYCQRLNLQVPVAVSVKTGEMADVFRRICKTAIDPCVSSPRCLHRALTCRHRFVLSDLSTVADTIRMPFPVVLTVRCPRRRDSEAWSG